MEEKELCAKCGGKCCLHPHLQPYEFKKFVEKFGLEAVSKMNPAQTGLGFVSIMNCIAATPTGCAFSYEDRPLICKIYPFELRRTAKGWKLDLDVATCPHWEVFGRYYNEMADVLKEYFDLTPVLVKAGMFKHGAWVPTVKQNVPEKV